MWKDLSLKEKAEIMRMSVANGVTDINDIQSLYDNSVGHLYDDGGEQLTGNEYIPLREEDNDKKFDNIQALFKRLRKAKVDPKVSADVMWDAERYFDTYLNTEKADASGDYDGYGDPTSQAIHQAADAIVNRRFSRYKHNRDDEHPQFIDNGTAQRTFLLNRHTQRDEFIKDGWIERPSDKFEYGLVASRVGDRKWPVYQNSPDKEWMLNLHPIANAMAGPDNNWFATTGVPLADPNEYPTAIYVSNNGKFYQKGWDVNDYGGGTGVTGGVPIFGDMLDYIGSPTVVTTGYQEIPNSTFWNKVYPKLTEEDYRKSSGIQMTPNFNQTMYDYYNLLPDVSVVYNKKTNKTNIGYNPGIKLRANGGYLFDRGGTIEKPIGHLYKNAGPLAKKKPYDYGDPNEITRIIADHELFRSSPYEDGPERGWYSVGFGTNNHGGAGQDANMRRILGYGWKELHAGRKMTREEAMKLMLYDINNNIKPLLRRTLGDKLYSELPGNFLNTFIDMGYQSPARMVKAARAYKTSGPDAAIKAMMMGKAKKVGGGTYDLTQRNNQRRAMWGASSNTKAGDVPDASYDFESIPSTGGGYTPQLSSQAAFQPIVIGGNPVEQSNPWIEYLARVNQPVMLNTPIGQTSAPQSVAQSISMPRLFEPVNFSSLQTNTNAQATVDPYVAKQVIEEGLGLENNALWNSPYLMFDNNLAANGGNLFNTAGIGSRITKFKSK